LSAWSRSVVVARLANKLAMEAMLDCAPKAVPTAAARQQLTIKRIRPHPRTSSSRHHAEKLA
jgi:hypothetical protein